MNTITQITISPDELRELIRQELTGAAQQKSEKENSNREIFITAQELRERCKISKGTEHNWRRAGLLRPRQMGHRVYYSWPEVQETIAGGKIKSKK